MIVVAGSEPGDAAARGTCRDEIGRAGRHGDRAAGGRRYTHSMLCLYP